MAILVENAAQQQASESLLDPQIIGRLRDLARRPPSLEHQGHTGRFGATQVENRFDKISSHSKVGKHWREALQFGI